VRLGSKPITFSVTIFAEKIRCVCPGKTGRIWVYFEQWASLKNAFAAVPQRALLPQSAFAGHSETRFGAVLFVKQPIESVNFGTSVSTFPCTLYLPVLGYGFTQLTWAKRFSPLPPSEAV
jgi:hypothetical protein